MSIFGGKRDISLFRSLNRELINKIIHVDVGIYKLVLADTKTNIYGESTDKVYYRPIKCTALVSRDEQSYEGTEFGQNYTANATFAFLRDDLKNIDLLTEVGDIILWDNEYYELDSLIENQYFAGKNQETVLDNTEDWGWNVSLVFSAHIMKISSLNLIDRRSGTNNDIDGYKE